MLVLDEPTNHLDLQMRNALMLALQNFEGALILVSHDRGLITSVCDSLILVANGRADEFIGDMADYAEHLKQARLERQARSNAVSESKPPNDTKELSKEEKRKLAAQYRNKTAPLRKQIDKLEKQLAKHSENLANIEAQLSDQSLYDDANKDKLLALLAEQTDAQKQLAEVEESLLMAMDELENLEASLEI